MFYDEEVKQATFFIFRPTLANREKKIYVPNSRCRGTYLSAVVTVTEHTRSTDAEDGRVAVYIIQNISRLEEPGLKQRLLACVGSPAYLSSEETTPFPVQLNFLGPDQVAGPDPRGVRT